MNSRSRGLAGEALFFSRQRHIDAARGPHQWQMSVRQRLQRGIQLVTEFVRQIIPKQNRKRSESQPSRTYWSQLVFQQSTLEGLQGIRRAGKSRLAHSPSLEKKACL